MSDRSIKDSTKVDEYVYTTDKPTNEHLKLSCLMRIADATEAMAKNYINMQSNLDYHRGWCRDLQKEVRRLKHSRAGYMAALTRLKNKQKA